MFLSTRWQPHDSPSELLVILIQCPSQKQSHHLDLTKQIGKILPLVNYCMGDYVMCPKNEVSWLPEYTEWSGYSINGCFLPWRHGMAYSNMTIPGFIGLKLWKSASRSMRLHFHTRIGHHRVQNQTLTPLRISGMCWRRLCTAVRLSHHQYKILAKNECNSGPE